MNTTDIPIWEKYTLTLEEAAKYFRIGESKLRRFIDENPNAKWVLMNGEYFTLKDPDLTVNKLHQTS